MVKKQAFKQADVTRALKGAMSGGMDVGKVEIELGGKITLTASGAAPAEADEFGAWKTKRDARKP